MISCIVSKGINSQRTFNWYSMLNRRPWRTFYLALTDLLKRRFKVRTRVGINALTILWPCVLDKALLTCGAPKSAAFDVDSMELASPGQFSGAIRVRSVWACRRISWRVSLLCFQEPRSGIGVKHGSQSRWPVMEADAGLGGITSSFVPAFTNLSGNRIWRVPLPWVVLTSSGKFSVRIMVLNWLE